MQKNRSSRLSRILEAGLWAGLAGGLAEVAWIMLYAAFGGADGGAVARAVAAVAFPTVAATASAPAIGLAVHMALAVALGVGVAVALRVLPPRPLGAHVEMIAVVGILVGIWAVNFLVILPVLDATLLGLVPLAVAFVSKVLFGICAAAALILGPAPTTARSRG